MTERLSWDAARGAALDLGRARIPRSVPVGLERALGQVLAVEVRAAIDLPAADVSAMDGWSVAGAGPWLLVDVGTGRLTAGHAAPVSTGQPVPRGTDAVVRSERGQVRDGVLAAPQPGPRADIRPRGEELRAQEVVLERGSTLTPARLGLAAAAGADALHVVVPPRAVLLVTGDELVDSGPGQPGRVRDSLSHVLPGLLSWLGVEIEQAARSGDDLVAIRDVFAGPYRSTVDLVVTTGGTAGGVADHVRRALADVGARLVVPGLAVRPGGPAMLAVVPDGPVVLALPGNPLAAVAALVSLVPPLLDGWLGRSPVQPPRVQARVGDPHPDLTRLVPATLDPRTGEAVSSGHSGPGMLRGLAAADGLVVQDPDGRTTWFALR